MNNKTRFAIPRLLTISFVLFASLMLFGEQAIGQEPSTSSSGTQGQDCCWIDITTGKRVLTAPASGINHASDLLDTWKRSGAWADPGIALLNDDRTSARNTRTGQQYRKDSDGCWIDITTGKRVRTVPATGINYASDLLDTWKRTGAWADPGVAIISDDGSSARNTRTGQQYAREPCPPPAGQVPQVGFKTNEINFNFSFIREDSDPRFNTYGFNGSYTYYFNPTVGVTGDVNAHFKSESSADLSKYSVLGGVTFVPFEGAKTTDKVTVSTHALFGVSHFKADNGTSSFTDNAFTIKLGGAVDLSVNEHVFIRLPQIDYAPTFFGGNTQHNFQVGVGVGFRFR